MMIFFSIFSALIRLIVDHLRKGSDAEVVEAEEMSWSVLVKFVKNIFDDDWSNVEVEASAALE